MDEPKGKYPDGRAKFEFAEDSNKVSEFINAGDFCEVAVDTWAEQGLEKGAVVYIAQLKPLPISEEDIYLQRIYVGAHFTEGYSIKLPEIYLMDPRDLVKVDEETLKIYKNQMTIDFGEEKGEVS